MTRPSIEEFSRKLNAFTHGKHQTLIENALIDKMLLFIPWN